MSHSSPSAGYWVGLGLVKSHLKMSAGSVKVGVGVCGQPPSKCDFVGTVFFFYVSGSGRNGMLVYCYGGLVVRFVSRDRNLAVLLMYYLAGPLRRPPFAGGAGGGHCAHSCCPAGCL